MLNFLSMIRAHTLHNHLCLEIPATEDSVRIPMVPTFSGWYFGHIVTPYSHFTLESSITSLISPKILGNIATCY